MIELGGNIKLGGFDGMETAKLIVVKKIVGNYVKNAQDNGIKFSSLTVDYHKGKTHEVTASLAIKKETLKASHAAPNLFFALDNVLKALSAQIE